MTSTDLTNIVRVKTILTNMNVQKSYRHIWPKKVKYPIPKIPDDSEKKSGTDWVLPKIIGSGRVSGTRQALVESSCGAVSVVDTDDDVDYKFWFKVENLKLLSGDYNVSVSSKRISHFKNAKVDIEYFIALEPESHYGS